jgi:hypothetical protein
MGGVGVALRIARRFVTAREALLVRACALAKSFFVWPRALSVSLPYLFSKPVLPVNCHSLRLKIKMEIVDTRIYSKPMRPYYSKS